ncbi:MAG: hypothetical protein PVH80_10025, partial [Anaerolineae bacterium]
MEKTGLSSVYLISGCKAGTTFQYRVLHKQEQLERFDIRTTVREGLAGRDGMLEEISNHDLLYLYRVAYGPFVERLIKGAREQDIPVVFGVDDLVFEPDLVHWVDPVKAMSQQEALGYYEGVWRYR